MPRRFNTAGPCRPDWHYMIPAERRLPEAPGLVEQLAYFVVHAPRQTGKTTAIRALAQELTASGRYAALYVSCEVGEAAGDDFGEAQRAILANLRLGASLSLPEELQPPPFPEAPDSLLLGTALSAWAGACPRPLVLFLDEIDALRGQSLISVLRQLRSGFPNRPGAFPASIILCGLRDVRDYKAASGGDADRLGTASPFNIKLKSLRLGDFDRDEVEELYKQHTADTGQPFTEQALARAFELTAGQPWLVNALAREVIEEMGIPVSEPITIDHVEAAKERLIYARVTHLDSLVARLHEPRIRRVLEPVLAGTLTSGDSYQDDVQYARDLGLLTPSNPVRVANPIYNEVIARVLAGDAELQVQAEPRSFVLPDGRLDFDRLLREFATFWREHGEVLTAGLSYHEVAPQLVLMAFLHRVVNGGGFVDREYGVGRGRIDLLVRWPYSEAGQRRWQRQAMELKVWREGEKDPLPKGLAQLDEYLERLSLDEGVLVVFDRRREAGDADSRTRFEQAQAPSGRKVTVLRA
ncbi:ATP-binding protein [Pyxidicoccus fallax]|uniref:ATP-binding protein n=1 Tax=Pyxidicoccus fallax TaxID=394095 RepID=A0A848LW00_9BACT|nr:ATP-binding protein [Pyxidicoccus fallax]NMO21811.1 ATP-binding protein [Pyxidicoccus fallax]NPC86730.1 ATP-binding protein [Pyxidicoccus fallax]